MKKKIDVIAGADSFHNLSTFNCIEEMNKTVRTYRDLIRSSVKRTDVQARLIALLELLKRHSCKYVGVSFLCKNSIADKLELSYKTVQRLVKKLEELGMICQVAMKRKKDMLQTANAVQIIPAQNVVSDKTPANKSDKCPANKTKSISLKQNINNKRNSVPSTDISKVNFVAHWVPEDFANLASNFYHDAKVIQELWKVVKQNNGIVDYETDQRAFTKNQELNIGIRALKEFAMKIKSGRKINNIFGYFNGIVTNLMDKLYFDTEFIG